MSTKVVNLDALIPREDLEIHSKAATPTQHPVIGIPHLSGFVFGPDLRKPQFQRETNQWTTKKVVDLITAFVDQSLIPAVILWRAGEFIFVVDGAHRLSALLAWIHDDYGDGQRSKDFFGGKVPDEQEKIADVTRRSVNKAVGSFIDYEQARKGTPKPAHVLQRLPTLGDCGVIAQWVPTSDPKAAEASFFKINQSATPIDATEKRILKSRNSASAIAARAITNAGSGHKYWGAFDSVTQAQIEEVSKAINHFLYLPPITGTPITTLDVPVAGRGYSVLPFVFDLVNETNGVSAADTTHKRAVKEAFPKDADGEETLSFLLRTKSVLSTITTDHSKSLGLHPVVWFYTRGGEFKAEAFFAAIRFLTALESKKSLPSFHKVRAAFEDYLVDRKEALALIVHKYGTGNRSISWLVNYYDVLFAQMAAGSSPEQIKAQLSVHPGLEFLTTPPPPAKTKALGQKQPFSSGIKTAAYFLQAMDSCIRCKLCGARIHRNSVHIDHIKKQEHGGHAGLSNAQVTHPYCDSVKVS